MERRFSFAPVSGIANNGFQLQESEISQQDTNNELIKVNVASSTNDKNEKKRKRSLLQITRDIFPRLENYRNFKTIKRPSIGELHEGEENVRNVNCHEDQEESKGEDHIGIKLGWIQGVLIPCLLNIFGVMLFLRLSWVVAEAGIGQSLVIIGISALICVITTISLSAISTNGEVKGGGIYYIISRSLGPEFGASVGIVLAFANSVSVSMNTIGFCNSLSDLLKTYDLQIIDGDINDARVVGLVVILVMILICAIGMEWESKAQNVLIAIIVFAMGDFLVGVIMGPSTDEQRAKGFVGFDSDTFATNWGPDYREFEGADYNFFQVFAIFFPSVTGIQAGANISGDLKDPASAIPKGTFLALVISMMSYVLFVVFAGAAAIRDASGNVTDVLNDTLSDCAPHCKYGLYNNYQMMQLMSGWEPLIYAGCFAATLSTALTNLLSVPRLIQALGIDKIYPGLIFFSKGYGKAGEPYRGYALTFIISVLFLLIGELNAIAPLISNFYLASYALINFCTFHAALIRPLGWRPTFKYYNTWLSLFGFVLCVVIMFLVNWQSSLITFIVILGLYLLVVYRKPDVNWGSSTQAQIYKAALTTAHKLINIDDHVKNYKPQILLLCESPSSRPALVDFANLITKNNSLLVIGDIVETKQTYRERSTRNSNAYAWLRKNKIKGFYTMMDRLQFQTGAIALLQAAGIGKLGPNVMMIGYKNNWRTCNKEELLGYFNVLHAAFEQRVSVAILRLKNGLDCGKAIDDERSSSENIFYPISAVDTQSIPGSNLMHTDSNLNLNSIGESYNENSQSVPSIKKKAKNENRLNSKLRMKCPSSMPRDSEQMPDFVLDNMMLFRKKQDKGNIDVWWLYDDGGLTMLLPYIISTRHNWSSCKIRVFALGTNKNNLKEEEENMASLLSKFRLKYSSLTIVSLNDKPQDSTIEFFNDIISEFRTNSEDMTENDCKVSETEINGLQEKTYRQLRLRELLLENSSQANLIVMSLPMPRKGKLSAPLYMAWLEALTKDLPPYLLVRGNHQSVLTLYS